MIQSSYNNLETQEAFDIYTSYTQILSQDDSLGKIVHTSCLSCYNGIGNSEDMVSSILCCSYQ